MGSESASVYLAPCDPESFDRTVRSAVELDAFPDRPAALDGLDEVRLWGAPDGSATRTYFEKMRPGDVVLFYADGDYVGTGTVGTPFEDEDGWASGALWESEEGDEEPWQLVFTIEDFTPVSVPRAAVNRLFDYADGYTPRGLMRVADERVENRPAAIKLAVERYSERN